MPETKELVINTTPLIALIAAAGSLDMLPLLGNSQQIKYQHNQFPSLKKRG